MLKLTEAFLTLPSCISQNINRQPWNAAESAKVVPRCTAYDYQMSTGREA